ncbi:MAG: VWA domain-containing protein, partial [Raineya sp.]
MLTFLFLVESEGWYRLEWFLPNTWQSYVWENVFWLYAIPFIILLPILRWLLVLPFRQKIHLVLPKDTKKFQRGAWRRFIPDIVLLLSLSLILVALARPQRVNEKTEKYSEGIDIVIAIDVSESMLYEDYTPNRLQTALQTAQNFIDGRLYEDRIGLVVFSGEAFTLVPLTTDYDLLRSYLKEEVKAQMTETEGTALGDALAVSINRLEQSKAKSKVIILISDGDSNAGRIQPLEAARLAQERQIKVY